MTRLLAAPATSRNVPRLALADRPTTLAVPLLERLPLVPPGGRVPATGRTRTFCQVSLHVTPLILVLVTVNTNCVVVTEVIATAVPLEIPLMLLAALPLPLSRVISTVGAVPPVSKINPLGAFRMMVPAPTFPLVFSE